MAPGERLVGALPSRNVPFVHLQRRERVIMMLDEALALTSDLDVEPFDELLRNRDRLRRPDTNISTANGVGTPLPKPHYKQ